MSDHAAVERQHRTIGIDRLHERDDNPRVHDLERLTELIRHNGFIDEPIVRRLGRRQAWEIIAGHGRIRAARALGYTEVPCIEIKADDDTARRLMLAANRASDNSRYDADALLAALEAGGIDGTGFTERELTRMLNAKAGGNRGADTDPDEATSRPTTQPGQRWRLGDHLLICGDASEVTGYRADAIVTDPPYGVAYGDKQRLLNEQDAGDRRPEDIAGDDDPDQAAKLLGSVLGHLTGAGLVAPGSMVYIWAPAADRALVGAADRHLEIRQQVIWVKNSTVMGRQDYHNQHEVCWVGATLEPTEADHEVCWVGWAPGAGHIYYGPVGASTVWYFDRRRKNDLHPTMKPVDLIERCIEHATSRGQTVVDPFCGSGTTIIAAENTERRAVGIEVDPGYCDTIARRYQQHTGRIPIDADTGLEHDFA